MCMLCNQSFSPLFKHLVKDQDVLCVARLQHSVMCSSQFVALSHTCSVHVKAFVITPVVVSISWKKPTRCCVQSPRRLRGSVKPRRRAANSCSSWRPTCASCRTNAVCWSAASWVWRRNASACSPRWRQSGGSTVRVQRPSAIWWVSDINTV